MSRSNINLVGNATEGQNVGTGIEIYKGKTVGNILQYKTLSVTGTTMSITCDDNNIYFSAQTGGGGGTTYWTSGASGLSPAAGEDVLLPENDLIKWADDSCITSSASGLTACGGVISLCNSSNYMQVNSSFLRLCSPTIYLGQSAYYIQTINGSKLMCLGAPSCWGANIVGGATTDATSAGSIRLCGGSSSSTGDGGCVVLNGGANTSTGVGGCVIICGGASTNGIGGHVYLRGGDGSGSNDGTIYLDGANTTGGFGKIVLGSPTTGSGIDTQNIITCGLATNISINMSTKGTGGIRLLTGSVALGNTSNAGFVFDCTNAKMCLPKNIQICGANGIASASCCDGWNIDMRGGFGSSNVGYAGSGGTICLCGGCACLGSGGSGAKDGGSVVLHSGPGINGGNDGRIVMDNLPAKTSETCTIYIDASGNLSTGVAGAGGGLCGCTVAGNTALGCDANPSNIGSDNVVIGYGAFCDSSAGADCNIAIGTAAFQCNTTGDANVFIGYVAGECTANASCRNVGIGEKAMWRTCGCFNTAVGAFSICGNSSGGGNGNYNTGLGATTLANLTSGICNAAVGTYAFLNLTSGSNNVGVGYFVGASTTTGSNNVFLGHSAGSNETGSDKLYVANSSTNNLIRGCFSNNTICNGGNSASWNTTSDCRIKECANTISAATTTLSQLNPITFDYTSEYSSLNGWDENQRTGNFGFSAQEFENVFPEYVTCSIDEISSGSTVNDFRTINTGHLVPILVKAIQELEARIQVLESQ